jgi:hypothetical protein
MVPNHSPVPTLELSPAPRQRGSIARWLFLAVILLSVVIVGIIGQRFQRHFLATGFFRGRSARVSWDIDRRNYLRGGVTEVHMPARAEAITDADLARLEELFHVELLDLSGCRLITGAGLAHVGRLSSLRDLFLGASSDTGRRPVPLNDDDLTHLTSLSRLRFLTLEDCPISDRGLDALQRLTALEFLDLSGTRVTVAGLEKLRRLPLLRTVRIERTGITPEQSAQFQSSRAGFELLDDSPVRDDMVRMRGKRDY